MALYLAAEVAIVLRRPMIAELPWLVAAATGSATVLSYSIVSTYVPSMALGRANATFNFAHLVATFAIQWLMGVVIGFWPAISGQHPVLAYEAALSSIMVVQYGSFVWFVVPSH